MESGEIDGLLGKKVVIFGAAGSIGTAVRTELRGRGAQVFLSVKSGVQCASIIESPCDVVGCADVSTVGDVREYASTLHVGSLHGCVYSVGHCPPGGFDAAVNRPLCDPSGHSRIQAEIEMHVLGLQNVFCYMLPRLLDGGSIVVVGSAITRLTDETCPEWLFAGPYAAAKAAQNELVLWMRRDPVVKKCGIKIHLLEFGAVDTPFHKGSEHLPPPLLSLDRVAKEVVAALESPVHVSKVVQAERPEPVS